MEEKRLFSVAEYAAAVGISKQAVYKQLNNKLKDFVVEVDCQKYIDVAALGLEVEQPIEQHSTQDEQPIEQPIQPFWQRQIDEKDKQIESLLRQIENLQQQNSKLTDLLQNSQVLLAAEKQLQIEQAKQEPPQPPQEEYHEPQEETPPPQKQGFFRRLFKKNTAK